MQLDENGKPCKACTDMTSFQNAMFAPTKQAPSTVSEAMKPQSTSDDPYRQEPPDSRQLGRSTWTFSHSLAAYFPQKPSVQQQEDAKESVTSLSKFYPCRPCAEDFQEYIQENKIDSSSRENFSLWMCDAHNAVNEKLGKPKFDCKYWSQRWREGWEDFKASQK